MQPVPVPYARPLTAVGGVPDVSVNVIAGFTVSVCEVSVFVCAGVETFAVSEMERFSGVEEPEMLPDVQL